MSTIEDHNPFENDELMVEFMRRCKGKVKLSLNNHPGIRRMLEGLHFEMRDIRSATQSAPRQGHGRRRMGEHRLGAGVCGWTVLRNLDIIPIY
jgi:hypothetical protein